MPKRQAEARGKYNFGGCQTCRKRHLKCDLRKPSCFACERSGIRCEGYKKDLKWVSNSKTPDRISVEVVPPHSQTGNETSVSTNELFGPEHRSVEYGYAKTKATSQVNAATQALQYEPFRVFDLDADSTESTSHTTLVPLYQENADPLPDFISSTEFHQSLDWPDLFQQEWLTTNDERENNHLRTSDQVCSSTPRISEQSNLQTAVLSPHVNISQITVETAAQDFTLCIQPHEVQMLLRHFMKTTFYHTSSFPSTWRGPIRTLNFNLALQTFTRLTFLEDETVTHAAFANLVGLLGLSASHFANTSIMKPPVIAYWKLVSASMFEQAKAHLQRSLCIELEAPNKAKYKDQLMAIIALLVSAILHDETQDARRYMIDAESLLKTRGLAKHRISRNCRLLHHYYTYNRVIAETTYVTRDLNSLAEENRTVPSNLNQTLDEFLWISPVAVQFTQDVNDGSDVEVGDSGEWADGTYRQLYGISEIWLSLVSQTTRMANTLHKLSKDSGTSRPDALFLDELERSKKKLENTICTFVATFKTPSSKDPQETLLTPHQYMVRALNPALAIYFYRRVRDVSPWVLQEYVNDIIHILHDFEKSSQKYEVDGPGNPWPVFMAACEAKGDEQRTYLLDWTKAAFKKTGFTRYETMRSTIAEVWRRSEKDPNGLDWTWMSVCRDRNSYMILS